MIISGAGNRDRFACWNGTGPLDASSGEQQRHRLSRAGNRRINRTSHITGVVQLRNPTAGRVCSDGSLSIWCCCWSRAVRIRVTRWPALTSPAAGVADRRPGRGCPASWLPKIWAASWIGPGRRRF
ncbi:transposase [Amycolatopsis mediterranei]|uniref:transposase n=1 Tax=Amycolatopsis mediterranei TaxID=33910 RepID=UPI0034238AB0